MIFLSILFSLFSLRFVISDVGVCKSPQCKQEAEKVLSKIDVSVDPCDDFYHFACGNYIRHHEVHKAHVASETAVMTERIEFELNGTLYSELHDNEIEAFKVGANFYRSCMDVDTVKSRGLKPLQDIIEEMGGWPVVQGQSWDSTISWQRVLEIAIEKGLWIEFPFNLEWDPDVLRNATQKILTISPAQLSLTNEMYKEQKEDLTYLKYMKHQQETAELFGASKDDAMLEMTKVLEFEAELSNVSTFGNHYSEIPEYIVLTHKELQNFSFIDWKSLMAKIVPPQFEMNENEKVGLGSLEYFRGLENLIKSTPTRTLVNFIIWRIIDSFASYLGHPKKYTFDPRPRESKCLELVLDTFPISVSAFWLRKNFELKSKSAVEKISGSIKKEFEDLLSSNEWMDDETKKKAVEKLDKMDVIIAYPDEFLDDKEISEIYSNITIDESKFFESVLKGNKFYFFKLFKTLYTNKKILTIPLISTVNAFNDITFNRITIPAGLLRHDFFNVFWTKNPRTEYLNFASLGFTIGHEMAHSFDDTGSYFDGYGSFQKWWTNETRNIYKEKLRCLIDQFDNFTDVLSNLNINGTKNLDENIADNVGIKLSHRAFKKNLEENKSFQLPGMNFTVNQIFWIIHSQTWCTRYDYEGATIQNEKYKHSLPQFRINGPLQNSKEFSRDFQCSDISSMNPHEKCELF